MRAYEAEAANGAHPATMTAGRRRRRPRQDKSIGVKKQIVLLRDAGISLSVVLRQLPIPITKDTGRRIMQSAAQYRVMANAPHTLVRMNCREGKSPELDALLYKLYLAVYSLGHRRIPITTALREEAACMKAGRLSIVGFAASNGYVRGFVKRYGICNVAMHGQAGATNLAAAAAAVEHIRRQLEAYPPDRIYNNNPTCFRGASNAGPLPYFNQTRAWMDKYVYERWWNTVFLPAVRERHRGFKCALIMDNASTQNVNLSAEDVHIFFLPHQQDSGVPANGRGSYCVSQAALQAAPFGHTCLVFACSPGSPFPPPPTSLPACSTTRAATGVPSDAATPRAHDPPYGPASLS